MNNTNPRVVIGAGRPNKLAALVCEYTIKKHCPDTEVIHTWHQPFLKKGDRILHRDRWAEPCEWLPAKSPLGTMFSYCRHMVPEICGNEGQAIYVDADMLVFASVQEVWDLDFGAAVVLGVEQDHQYSVLKIDCASLRNWTMRRFLTGTYSHDQIMRGKHLAEHEFVRKIPNVWNHKDRRTSATKLLHYTKMPTQPWVFTTHAFGEVWFNELAEAVQEGVIARTTVEEEIKEQDLRKVWPAAAWPQPHVIEELERRLAG